MDTRGNVQFPERLQLSKQQPSHTLTQEQGAASAEHVETQARRVSPCRAARSARSRGSTQSRGLTAAG